MCTGGGRTRGGDRAHTQRPYGQVAGELCSVKLRRELIGAAVKIFVYL